MSVSVFEARWEEQQKALKDKEAEIKTTHEARLGEIEHTHDEKSAPLQKVYDYALAHGAPEEINEASQELHAEDTRYSIEVAGEINNYDGKMEALQKEKDSLKQGLPGASLYVNVVDAVEKVDKVVEDHVVAMADAVGSVAGKVLEHAGDLAHTAGTAVEKGADFIDLHVQLPPGVKDPTVDLMRLTAQVLQTPEVIPASISDAARRVVEAVTGPFTPDDHKSNQEGPQGPPTKEQWIGQQINQLEKAWDQKVQDWNDNPTKVVSPQQKMEMGETVHELITTAKQIRESVALEDGHQQRRAEIDHDQSERPQNKAWLLKSLDEDHLKRQEQLEQKHDKEIGELGKTRQGREEKREFVEEAFAKADQTIDRKYPDDSPAKDTAKGLLAIQEHVQLEKLAQEQESARRLERDPQREREPDPLVR
jgi:hypothetical protein